VTYVVCRGIGTAVPAHAYEQNETAELFLRYAQEPIRHQQRTWEHIFQQTGIARRYSVLTRQEFEAWAQAAAAVHGSADSVPSTGWRMQRFAREAPPLAAQALGAALEAAGCPTNALDYLVLVTCTGFFAPGLDCALVDALHLRPDVERVQVGYMGCHGAIDGLRVLGALLQCRTGAWGAVCAVELCSLHHYAGTDPERYLGNCLFADGAAALAAQSAPEPQSWTVRATGCVLLAQASEMMSWHIGDHGFEMTLSPRLPGTLRRHVRPWLEAWLGRQGLSLGDVRSWAIHPGGPRILQAAQQALGLTDEHCWASWDVLKQYGNVSSASVLFVLERLRRSGAAPPCVTLAFGPGLTLEAALFV